MYFEIVLSISALVVGLLGYATTLPAETVKVEEVKVHWEGGF